MTNGMVGDWLRFDKLFRVRNYSSACVHELFLILKLNKFSYCGKMNEIGPNIVRVT